MTATSPSNESTTRAIQPRYHQLDRLSRALCGMLRLLGFIYRPQPQFPRSELLLIRITKSTPQFWSGWQTSTNHSMLKSFCIVFSRTHNRRKRPRLGAPTTWPYEHEDANSAGKVARLGNSRLSRRTTTRHRKIVLDSTTISSLSLNCDQEKRASFHGPPTLLNSFSHA